MHNRGFRISIVCFGASDDLFKYCDILELKKSRLCDWPFFWKFGYWLDYICYNKQISNANLETPDIVVGGEHLLLKSHHHKFSSVPFIYLPHSLIVSTEIKSYGLDKVQEYLGIVLYTRIQKWALKKADWIMRFSRKSAEILQNHYGISLEKRLIVNPIGIDIPSYPKTLDKNEKTLKLLFVGRLVNSKNIFMALQCLFRLRKYNWELNIIGGGDQRDLLEKRVNEEGLASRIHFMGHCADVAKWYEASDVFLFPSKLESLGMVILEAMSYGIPALAMMPDGITYHTVSDEIIDDDNTGWLAVSEDDFYVKLERIMNNHSMVHEVGSTARKVILEKHSWDKHIEKYESLINN